MRVTQNTPHPDPLVQVASFSDLFFNYDHPKYDGLEPINTPSTDEERRAALVDDATEFAETLQNATGFGLNIEELVDDFLNRL